MQTEQMSDQVTFANLAERLKRIIDSIPIIEKPLHAIFNKYAEWGGEEHPEVTEILVAAFKLLESQPAKRAETHIKDIEELLDEHLHHKYARFEFSREIFERDDFFENHHIEDVYYAYDYCAKGLLERLKVFAGEYPNVVLEETTVKTEGSKTELNTPTAKRDYVASTLGMKRSSLGTYVSDWKKKYEVDLPWVIRKPGMSWFVNVEKFEQWLTTSEGQKKKRGRPRKNG